MLRQVHARATTLASRWTVAVIGAAFIGGCVDTPTSTPPSASRLAPSLNASSGTSSPQRFPNAIKYRDAGHKPSTGRSGSASLMVRALLGKDRQTALELTTGALDDAATPPGNIEKIQLKLFDVAGGLMSTRNYNNLQTGGFASYSLANLTRGSGVQVQANVRGIDANRTDVVTVNGTVRMRPDIAVTGLTAPPSALVDVPLTIVAEVGELNGDVGARADCVLSVNGAPVRTATGIWVDAAGVVSCLFSLSIPTAGRAQIAVAATGVVPGDYDTGNNVAETSILVEERATGFFFGVTAADFRHTAGWRVSTEYTYGPDPAGVTRSLKSSEVTSRFEMHQLFGAISGSLDRELSFPILGLAISHETGGSTLLARSWDLAALPERFIDNEHLRQNCGASYEFFDNNRGAIFTDICSGVSKFGGVEHPFTFFGHVRLLSQVTYWVARGEVEIHDPSLVPPDQFWTYNVNIDQPSTLPSFGSSYRIRMELPSGNWIYVNDATVELAPYQLEFPAEPWTCRPITIPYYVGQNCEERFGGGEVGLRGFMSGIGTVVAGGTQRAAVSGG